LFPWKRKKMGQGTPHTTTRAMPIYVQSSAPITDLPLELRDVPMPPQEELDRLCRSFSLVSVTDESITFAVRSAMILLTPEVVEGFEKTFQLVDKGFSGLMFLTISHAYALFFLSGSRDEEGKREKLVEKINSMTRRLQNKCLTNITCEPLYGCTFNNMFL
jgi:hypothetical protein